MNKTFLSLLLISFFSGFFFAEESEKADVIAFVKKVEAQQGKFIETGFSYDKKNIVFVRLADEFISPTNICLISQIRTVKKVELACYKDGVSVTSDNMFAPLSNLPELKGLSIYGGVPVLTEKMCMDIARFKTLEVLEIEFVKVEKRGLDWLEKMMKVKLKIPAAVDMGN